MNNFLRASCSGAKNFFPLPNAIFSLGLSAGELAVYAYLMHCEDRRSHQCWPSYKTICRAVGMSENTVRKYVRELEYKTLILTEHTKYESESGQVRNGICGPCEGRVRRFGLDTGEVAITGLKQPCGAFVAICESSFGRRQKPHQICRGLQVYPAKQGAGNGQKDKQVKARCLPRR